MKKLYVGNLPFEMTEDELGNEFSKFGTVTEVKIITDRDTGRSRGFAFVSMENDSDADSAIASLNNQDLGGRKAMVNEAREREPRSGGGGGRGGYGGGGRGGYRR